MTKFLRDIATIQSGYTFRQKVQHDPEGDVYVIQYRDIDEPLAINTRTPARVKRSFVPTNQLLNQGDLLFLGKSSNNKVLVYNGQFAQAVATSLFLVIRVKDREHVLPGYLAWYINQWPAQQFLESRMSGSIVANIAKRDLSELKIPVPSLNQQQKITDVYNLSQREYNLRQEINQKRLEVANQLLLHQVNPNN